MSKKKSAAKKVSPPKAKPAPKKKAAPSKKGTSTRRAIKKPKTLRRTNWVAKLFPAPPTTRGVARTKAAARSTGTTADQVAAVFVTGFIPDIVAAGAPTSSVDAWMKWALKLRMDQSVWFAAGSTPSALTAGKAKAAAAELMNDIESGANIARADGLTGVQIRDQLVTLISDGSKTAQDLSNLIAGLYQF